MSRHQRHTPLTPPLVRRRRFPGTPELSLPISIPSSHLLLVPDFVLLSMCHVISNCVMPEKVKNLKSKNTNLLLSSSLSSPSMHHEYQPCPQHQCLQHLCPGSCVSPSSTRSSPRRCNSDRRKKYESGEDWSARGRQVDRAGKDPESRLFVYRLRSCATQAVYIRELRNLFAFALVNRASKVWLRCVTVT